MKKNVGLFLLVLACMYFGTATVYADLIFEPVDNFYDKHANECEYVDRSYIVNGYDGKTEVYKSPVSAKVKTTLESGKICFVSFAYTDKKGNEWGYIDNVDGNSGWVPMVYMYPVYDSQSFYDEYSDQLADETGSFSGKEAELVYTWDYPGSKEHDSLEIEEDSSLTYDTVFVDEEGHRFGHVGYYRGDRDFWICIDEPANPDLPVRQVDKEMPNPPKTIERVSESPSKVVQDIKEKGWSVIWPVLVLVIIVLSISYLLIRKFYGRAKK